MTTEVQYESVVLSTVLCLVYLCMMFYLLLIVLFNGELDDVFLTENFVGRGLDKVVDILTAFWIFKPVGSLFGSTIG